MSTPNLSDLVQDFCVHHLQTRVLPMQQHFKLSLSGVWSILIKSIEFVIVDLTLASLAA